MSVSITWRGRVIGAEGGESSLRMDIKKDGADGKRV